MEDIRTEFSQFPQVPVCVIELLRPGNCMIGQLLRGFKITAVREELCDASGSEAVVRKYGGKVGSDETSLDQSESISF